MKAVAVAILALALGTGCGVGADEHYDGTTLVTAQGQALEAEGDTAPGLEKPAVPQPQVTTTPSVTRDPGLVALPQDPIPVFEGKPAPQTNPILPSQPFPMGPMGPPIR